MPWCCWVTDAVFASDLCVGGFWEVSVPGVCVVEPLCCLVPMLEVWLGWGQRSPLLSCKMGHTKSVVPNQAEIVEMNFFW